MSRPCAALQRGVALDGRLFAARHDDLQLVGRVIQGAAGGNGFDLGLAGPGRDQHRNARHVLVHARRLKSGARNFKVQKSNGFDNFGRGLTFPPAPDGVVAQLVERLNGIQEVRGSNPLGSTILFTSTVCGCLRAPRPQPISSVLVKVGKCANLKNTASNTNTAAKPRCGIFTESAPWAVLVVKKVKISHPPIVGPMLVPKEERHGAAGWA